MYRRMRYPSPNGLTISHHHLRRTSGASWPSSGTSTMPWKSARPRSPSRRAASCRLCVGERVRGSSAPLLMSGEPVGFLLGRSGSSGMSQSLPRDGGKLAGIGYARPRACRCVRNVARRAMPHSPLLWLCLVSEEPWQLSGHCQMHLHGCCACMVASCRLSAPCNVCVF